MLKYVEFEFIKREGSDALDDLDVGVRIILNWRYVDIILEVGLLCVFSWYRIGDSCCDW